MSPCSPPRPTPVYAHALAMLLSLQMFTTSSASGREFEWKYLANWFFSLSGLSARILLQLKQNSVMENGDWRKNDEERKKYASFFSALRHTYDRHTYDHEEMTNRGDHEGRKKGGRRAEEGRNGGRRRGKREDAGERDSTVQYGT